MENFMSESISTLIAAVTKTILSIDGIDKNTTVGEGKYKYDGVSDKDVKNVVGKTMAANGLCILPIDINSKETVTSWIEKNQYGDKQKTSTFTVVNTKYILAHISGEWIVVSGYGQGIDSHDKSAGKATTYALKYLMLYSFSIATGSIDDTDNTHSKDIETPHTKKDPKESEQKTLAKAQVKDFEAMKKAVAEKSVTIEYCKEKYALNSQQIAELVAIELKPTE